MKFYLYKRGGGGRKQFLNLLKGGYNKFWGSFTTEA